MDKLFHNAKQGESYSPYSQKENESPNQGFKNRQNRSYFCGF
jgi:hypothetical protein